MNLENYSADDALDEWANDHTRAPALLRHAVQIQGVEATIAGIMRRGFLRSIAMGALRTAGLIQPVTRAAVPEKTPLEKLVQSLAREFPKLEPGEKHRLAELVQEMASA